MKFKIILMRISFILFTLQFVGCKEEVILVNDGNSEYNIYVSEDAIPSEKHAALELHKYIYEISNCKIPITNKHISNKKYLFVGFNDVTESIYENFKVDDFGVEEYVIQTVDNGIIVAGGGNRGTLYGVIGFLSDYLDCKWYTRDFSKIPKKNEIKLSPISIREKPIFEYREAWYKEAYNSEWAVHNRLNPSIEAINDSLGGGYKIYPFVHTFYQLVSPQKYFKTHPEYFSIVNGARKGHEAQLCLTNPEVVKIATNTVFNWIKQHPDAVVFSVDQNDGYGFCECEKCKTIDEKEGSKAGTILNFVNQIADSVYKKYPNIRLQTLAYAYSEEPPKYIKPHPIVTMRLCHYNYCSAHSLEGCDNHKIFIARLKKWSKITKRITIWDYFTDFNHYLIPFPNFESLKNDIRFYAENNCIGLFAQGSNVANNGGGEFASLRSWVLAKLMWNPYQDTQLLIDEFITNVYGEAAPYIKTYIDLLHNKVKPDSVYFSIYSDPTECSYLTPQVIKESVKLFQKAEEVVSHNKSLLKRVELAGLPILYTQLYFNSVGGISYLNSEKKPSVLKKFNRIISENGIVHLAENKKRGDLDNFLEKMKYNYHYITDWWIVGPFDNKDKQGLEISYGPEKSFDSTQTFIGKNSSTLNWNHRANRNAGYMDFTKYFTDFNEGVAYAYCSLNLKEDSSIKFGVGSNDGVRLFINGKMKLNRQVERKAEPSQDILTVNMKKGENSILLKIDQTGGGWGFYFTILEGSQYIVN